MHIAEVCAARCTVRALVLVFGAVCLAGAAFAERENIWPEGKMPNVQGHQIAAMTNEK